MVAVPDEAEGAQVGYEGVGGDPGRFWEEVGWINNQLTVISTLYFSYQMVFKARDATSAENAESDPITDS